LPVISRSNGGAGGGRRPGCEAPRGSVPAAANGPRIRPSGQLPPAGEAAGDEEEERAPAQEDRDFGHDGGRPEVAPENVEEAFERQELNATRPSFWIASGIRKRGNIEPPSAESERMTRFESATSCFLLFASAASTSPNDEAASASAPP